MLSLFAKTFSTATRQKRWDGNATLPRADWETRFRTERRDLEARLLESELGKTRYL